jgi:hypothetical protein
MEAEASESQRIESAKAVLLSIMPKKEDYKGVSEDLISFFQKRDFKWKFGFNQELLDDLGEHLLPTELFPITFQEANRLRSNYLQSKTTSDILDDSTLGNLSIRLQASMDRVCTEYQVDGVFLKLSFMSPKDVALRTDSKITQSTFKELLLSQIKKSEEENASFHDQFFEYVNEKEISGTKSEIHDFFINLNRIFVDSLYASLKVKRASEGLLTISQSYRCSEELGEAVVGPEIYFKTNIVIRPWIQIKPGFEFRIYVSNSKITCASQYESIYYPEVWKNKEKLQNSISKFVKENVISKISYRLPSFVVDIVMDENDRLYVCELNPFATTSSACLFNWSEDKTLLMIGPETWRFASEEKSKVEYLSDEWVAWVRFNFTKRDNYTIPFGIVVVGLISILVSHQLFSSWRI